MSKFFTLAATILILCSPRVFAVGEAAQVFTFDGRLYSDSAGTVPMVDPSIVLRIQVLDPTQTCILYDETQSSVSTAATNGYFTVQVGSETGDPKRTSGSDVGNAMAALYSNTVASVSGKLVSNGSVCAYTPASGDQRYLRMTVTPSGTGVANVLSPNMPLDSVPAAIVAERAESLQGMMPTQFIQVNTMAPAVLSQANLQNVFSTTNYPILTELLGGTSTLYAKTGANGTTQLDSVTTPPSPVAGEIWYDSGSIKYYNGTTTQTLGVSGAGVTGVTAGTGLNVGAGPGGTISSTGTLNINVGSGASQIVQLNGTAQLPAVDGSLLTSLSGTAIMSGTIGGTTAISTTGNLLTTGSVTAAKDYLYDHSGAGPGYVGFQAPADIVGSGGASYIMTFPNSAGTNKQVLTTNGAGVLAWSDLSSASGSVSLTSQVTGILPLANGGTNANLTASNGGMVYSNNSQMQILSGTATAGLPLISGSSAAPSWSTVSLAGGSVTLPAAGSITNASGPMTVTATTNLTVQSAAGSTTNVGNSSGASTTAIASGTGGISLSPATGGHLSVPAWTTAGLVKNDASGNLTGGNSLASADVTTALGFTPVNKAGDTMTGSLTAPSFIPNSSTAPTNGVYLPAANTVGISANSTAAAQFTSTGMNATVIGATTPAAGTFTTVGASSFGSATAPAFYFSGNPLTGIYGDGAGGVIVTSGGSSVLGIHNGTGVAIGTSYSTGGVPTNGLAVQGNVGIGTVSPSAVLQLKAGTATAGTAPLKLTAGVNLTTPEAGAIEFDGTSLYYTTSAGSRQALGTAGGSGTVSSATANQLAYYTGRHDGLGPDIGKQWRAGHEQHRSSFD